MRKGVAWPGVRAKKAKGKVYYYWTKTDPWVPMPNPLVQPDAFMRKLADLQRVALKAEQARVGTLKATITLYRKHPDYLDRKPNTKSLYDTYMDRLVEIWPDTAMADITRPLVQEFVMDLHADTRGAANVMLKMLHILYRWAQRRKEGLVDPTKGIRPYPVGEHDPWPEHVLQAALESDDDKFRLAVVAHLYTGQRTGDTCNMSWNIITADGEIPVIQEKTGTPLLIPIHPKFKEELQAAERPALSILSNRMGGRLRPNAFRTWCTTFGEQFGIKLVPHGLRKNAVIGLLEAGCSTAEVSSITGQTLAVVEHYAKQRNQPKIATVAIAKWALAGTNGQKKNGKTFADGENFSRKAVK